MKKDGPKAPNRPKKIRRRRTSATIGGTTQSAFANQSMSSVLAGQQSAAADKAAAEKVAAEKAASEKAASAKRAQRAKKPEEDEDDAVSDEENECPESGPAK